jgi:hypothetical protein
MALRVGVVRLYAGAHEGVIEVLLARITKDGADWVVRTQWEEAGLFPLGRTAFGKRLAERKVRGGSSPPTPPPSPLTPPQKGGRARRARARRRVFGLLRVGGLVLRPPCAQGATVLLSVEEAKAARAALPTDCGVQLPTGPVRFLGGGSAG